MEASAQMPTLSIRIEAPALTDCTAIFDDQRFRLPSNRQQFEAAMRPYVRTRSAVHFVAAVYSSQCVGAAIFAAHEVGFVMVGFISEPPQMTGP